MPSFQIIFPVTLELIPIFVLIRTIVAIIIFELPSEGIAIEQDNFSFTFAIILPGSIKNSPLTVEILSFSLSSALLKIPCILILVHIF